MTQSEENNLSKGFDERANVEEDFDDFRYLYGKILVAEDSEFDRELIE